MANVIAPKDQVWVCAACGKQSQDKYGLLAIDIGWDVSCMMSSILCYKKKDEDSNWIAVPEKEEIDG
jgi:hypothetical protein